jgi:hypothetical protein
VSRRRAWFLGLAGLAAATGAWAAEPASAPLEGTKQELRKLQADQSANPDTGVTGKLTGAMPQLQTPVPGTMPMEQLATREKTERERQKKAETQKNWLRDGVDQLGKSNDGKHPDKTASDSAMGATEQDKDRPDSSDPNYLLKVYTEQKNADEAKGGREKAAAPRADPFAPFLQGWLENSPVRGRFFDDFVRKPDGVDGGTQPPVASSAAVSTGAAFSPAEAAGGSHRAPGTAQPNPYLQGLDLGSLPDPGNTRGPAAATAGALPSPVPVQSAGGVVDPIPSSRAEEKKPLSLPPSDDKKYFPQLRKF